MHTDADPLHDTTFTRPRMMGPNCLRLAEELLDHVDLTACGRVLDLGCGLGLTSLLLARRTRAQIVAFDLWIDAATNQDCFNRLGLGRDILAVHGDVRQMPFGQAAFDAVVCIDAYCYFGADPRFLDDHLAPRLGPGGTIAVAVPGLQKEFTDGVPDVLQPFWQEDINFHDAPWWEELFSRASRVRLQECFSLAGHAQAWREWLECDNPYAKRDITMMAAENGQYFDTIGLIATVV
jgi:cyclopropane fatty-acyl-phospholipid synthase-like methyltransferase